MDILKVKGMSAAQFMATLHIGREVQGYTTCLWHIRIRGER